MSGLRLAMAGALLLLITKAAGSRDVVPGDVPPGLSVLESRSAFDGASREEIAGFVTALAELEALPETDRLRVLRLARIHPDSVRTWRMLTFARLAENVRRASRDCRLSDELCAPQMTGDGLEMWAAARRDRATGPPSSGTAETRAFHRAYVAEQLRLAALFPETTSEVLTYSDQERTGFELGDREFRLTFDDGPTAPRGATDRLLDVLHAAGRSGTFYMLGERVAARRQQETTEDLRRHFAGMCVASHGWKHESHQRMDTWPSSVSDTEQILSETFGDLHRRRFRPPYGQRSADAGTTLSRQGIGLILWNIDSRDWSRGLRSEEVAVRVVRLMLLWRRGIILFHDVHDRAREALPMIWRVTEGSGVTWLDCAGDE
jgi:peptidoglycan/xylan/chitin deacetylase (PgdA/CDA1 family)